jgi:hypothetical protein
MLVDVSKNEQEVLEALRTDWFYLTGSFGREYEQRVRETRKLVEVAKIYVLDNYSKVKSWRNLWTTIRAANYDNLVYIHKRDSELRKERRLRQKTNGKENRPRARKMRLEKFEDIFKELDKKTVSPKTFTGAVYDWTDGDFSVKINGKWYNWINAQAIIDIAAYIEEQLSENPIPNVR